MPIFQSFANSLADFNDGSPHQQLPNETVVIDPNGGPAGIGDSAVKMTFTANDATFNEVSVRHQQAGTKCRMAQWDMKVDAAANISNEHTLFHCWTFVNGVPFDLIQLRIYPVNGDANRYSLVVYDGTYQAAPNNNQKTFNTFLKATYRMNKGQWYTVKLVMEDQNVALYVAPQGQTPWQQICFQPQGFPFGVPQTYTGQFMDECVWGKFFSQNYNGVLWLDNFIVDTVAAPQVFTTSNGILWDLWNGFKTRRLRPDGAVIRPNPDGQNALFQQWSDVVSEGQAYGLFFAVIFGDRAAFDLMETWTYTHIRRANVTNPNGGNNGQDMMGWHWADDEPTQIPNNAFANGYDANMATDAEVDRLYALLCAHLRWGSGGTVNYLQHAQALESDLRNFAWVVDSNNGHNYQGVDLSSIPASPKNSGRMDMANAYDNIITYQKVINVIGNATFWNNAILGAMDSLNGVTDPNNNQGLGTTTGFALMPDWNGFDFGLGQMCTPPNPSRATDLFFSYQAFRGIYRYYWAMLLYNTPGIKSYFSNKAAPFYRQFWNNHGDIFMQLNHDGTIHDPGDKKGMGTFCAYFSILADNPNDPLLATIFNQKIDPAILYKPSVNGSYSSSYGPNGYSSYFNDSWYLFALITFFGFFTDITGPGGIPLPSGGTTSTSTSSSTTSSTSTTSTTTTSSTTSHSTTISGTTTSTSSTTTSSTSSSTTTSTTSSTSSTLSTSSSSSTTTTSSSTSSSSTSSLSTSTTITQGGPPPPTITITKRVETIITTKSH